MKTKHETVKTSDELFNFIIESLIAHKKNGAILFDANIRRYDYPGPITSDGLETRVPGREITITLTIQTKQNETN